LNRIAKKQKKYISQQQKLRKKSAKKRTAIKRAAIQKLKNQKSKKLAIANNKLQLISTDSLKQPNEQKFCSKRRRKDKIRQNDMASDVMDDDDLFLHEIASKRPISTKVANTMKFYTSDRNILSEHEQSYSKSQSDSVSLTAVTIGHEGDDEDESDGAHDGIMDVSKYNINEKLDDLPESSIINRPFIVNNKSKRIQQLEMIIIELCEKYICASSHFQLNLPRHTRDEIEVKMEEMRRNVRGYSNKNRHKREKLNGYGDDDGDSDDSGPHTKLQLMTAESNSFFHDGCQQNALSCNEVAICHITSRQGKGWIR